MSVLSRSKNAAAAMPPRLSTAWPRGSALGLAAQLEDRQEHPAEGVIHHPRERRVPRGRGRREPEVTTELDRADARIRVADAEDDERRREQDEHQRNRRAYAQRRDEHVRGEDAPGDQVQPDRVPERRLVRDALLVEVPDGPERVPERAVGR